MYSVVSEVPHSVTHLLSENEIRMHVSFIQIRHRDEVLRHMVTVTLCSAGVERYSGSTMSAGSLMINARDKRNGHHVLLGQCITSMAEIEGEGGGGGRG
jgi:hypothetical protein